MKISYVIDQKLVRDVDYYNKPVFEIHPQHWPLNSLGGGRHYDGLLKRMGVLISPVAVLEGCMNASFKQCLPKKPFFLKTASRLFFIALGEPRISFEHLSHCEERVSCGYGPSGKS